MSTSHPSLPTFATPPSWQASEAPMARRQITVRAGDTLTGLAARVLGDAGRWRELFEANRDRIASPNALSVGMALVLPGGEAATPAPAPRVPAGGSGWLWDLAREMGARHGVDAHLLMAVVQEASKGDAGLVGACGAQGLMQLAPAVSKSLGVKYPLNPRQNMDGGARYLKGLIDYYNGSVDLALAAYRAGTGSVDRYGGMPPCAETRRYVPAVLASYRAYAAA